MEINTQWQVDSDMRDTCFICGCKAYDFEHHGNVSCFIYYFI